MSYYTLLTGSTGLVGRYLLRDMLLNGQRLAVVVRPSRRESADERIEGICQFWERETGKQLPRPIVLSGDISEPGLGLGEEQTAWVAAHCRRIIHSAAILEFHGSDRTQEPWRTNLDGTRHVLELCRSTGIDDLHYVSTAYVAGTRTDRVMEDDLDQGQGFRNDYEHSKFEAEKLVRNADFLDRPTIYRPAVISGDSRTGYTNTYHGIYLYLRLMAMVIPTVPADANGVRHTPIRLAMSGEEARNVIPVDWVSEVTCRLLEMPEARGLTFHMAPDVPLTSGDLIRRCGDYFKTTGVEFAGTDSEEAADQADFGRTLIPNMTMYQAYETTDNVYDMTNLKRLLPDLPCPEIDRTVLYRYIEYGEEDRWGKRRPQAPEVSFRIEQHLPATTGTDQPIEHTIGLDVAGPGGGQWTVRMTEGRITDIETGLPVEEVPILRLSVLEYVRLSNNPAGIAEAGTSLFEEEEIDPAVAERMLQSLFTDTVTASSAE